MSARALPRDFYARPTLDVARELVGMVLVTQSRNGMTAGRIIEVEAYIGEDDPACHAAAGPTARNAPLYGPPGFAYVYLNYGLHHLVNAVTEPEGSPAAVLVRALQPLEGLALMQRRRARQGAPAHRQTPETICQGPGNLTVAMGITLAHNRLDLTGAAMWVEDRGMAARQVEWTPRVGIRVGLDRLWRARERV